jgi:superfamily II DNA or RNA helicase
MVSTNPDDSRHTNGNFLYCINSESWKYDDERLRNGEKIYKIGQTTNISRRKWDYLNYLPHQAKYSFWFEILEFGNFKGKTIEDIEQTLFKTPYFKKIQYYHNSGVEFFKHDNIDLIKTKIKGFLQSKNVIFNLYEIDIFLTRPRSTTSETDILEEIVEKNKVIQLDKIELRTYQKEALNEMKIHKFGKVVLPTGSGKTIIFTEYIREVKGRYLIVVPSLILKRQICKVLKFTLDKSIEINTKLEENIKDYSVTISTYQLSTKLLKNNWSCIIFDESHYTCIHTNTHRSKKEQNEYSMFQKLLKHKCSSKFFFTATLKNVYFVKTTEESKTTTTEESSHQNEIISMDNEKIYGKLLYEYGLDQAITDGYLMDYIFKIVGTSDKLSKLHGLIGNYQKIMIFCSCLKTVRMVYDSLSESQSNLNSSISNVFKLDCKKSEDIEDIVNKFGKCKTGILIACKKGMVGYDEPSIECIIHFDISSSSIETLQKNGRALRIHEDKYIATIIFMVSLDKDEDKTKIQLKQLCRLIASYKIIDKRLRDRIESDSIQEKTSNKWVELHIDYEEREVKVYNRFWNDIIFKEEKHIRNKIISENKRRRNANEEYIFSKNQCIEFFKSCGIEEHELPDLNNWIKYCLGKELFDGMTKNTIMIK